MNIIGWTWLCHRDCGCMLLQAFATVSDLIHSFPFTWRKPPRPAVRSSLARSCPCWSRRSRLTARVLLAVPVGSRRYSPARTTYSGSYREGKNKHICLLTETAARNSHKNHQIKTVLTCTGNTLGRLPGEKWFSLLICGDKMQGKERSSWSPVGLWHYSLSYRNRRNCQN